MCDDALFADELFGGPNPLEALQSSSRQSRAWRSDLNQLRVRQPSTTRGGVSFSSFSSVFFDFAAPSVSSWRTLPRRRTLSSSRPHRRLNMTSPPCRLDWPSSFQMPSREKRQPPPPHHRICCARRRQAKNLPTPVTCHRRRRRRRHLLSLSLFRLPL